MNRIRMIAFDLDGTLLTTDKELTAYTKEVLERAIQQNIEVIPATGRPLKGVPEIFFQFPGIRYIVTSNGARTVEKESRKTLFSSLLSYECAKEILDIFREYDTMRDLFFDGQGYMEKRMAEQISRFVKVPAAVSYMLASRIQVQDIDEMFLKEHRDVDKVQALFASEEERREAFERIRKLPGAEPTGALGNNIEVNAAGVHKGAALLRIAGGLGIAPEEILAFGDGTNDIRMLQAAGTGIAMDNAVQEVKEAADGITRSNDEEGVAVYIEKNVLDRRQSADSMCAQAEKRRS